MLGTFKEYKDAKKPEKLYKTFKIQVFAESLLVKELFKYSVPYAFIKFEQTGDLVKVKIKEEELLQVRETIQKINQIIQIEIMPDPTPFIRRCKDCGYFKICRRA
ncbi:MAG: Dna2/Cas4 domain-containing protein [Candidatus Diapherotrites archaeon]